MHDIDIFHATMVRSLKKWTEQWNKLGALSIIVAYHEGEMKGLTAWAEGEKQFWSDLWGVSSSTLGQVSSYAFDKANNGPLKTNHSKPPLYGSVMYEGPEPTLLDKVHDTVNQTLNFYHGVGSDISDGLSEAWEGTPELWGSIDAIMDFFKALVSQQINDMQAALESLAELPGEIGEIFAELIGLTKAALDSMSKWMEMMLELIGRTDVLEQLCRVTITIILLMTPNFWAEVSGQVTGFILPELLIEVIFTIIGALLSATGLGEVAVATRIVAFSRKFKLLLKTIFEGPGKILDYLLNKIKALMNAITKFGEELIDSRNMIGVRQELAMVGAPNDLSKIKPLKAEAHGDGGGKTSKNKSSEEGESTNSKPDESSGDSSAVTVNVAKPYLVKFSPNYDKHMREIELNPEGKRLRGKQSGYSGGHEKEGFLKALKEDGEIVKGYPITDPKIPGALFYAYQFKALGPPPDYKDLGRLKSKIYYKTVLDTKVYPLEKLKRESEFIVQKYLEKHREFPQNGDKLLEFRRKGIRGQASTGEQIQIYINESGEITTSYIHSALFIEL